MSVYNHTPPPPRPFFHGQYLHSSWNTIGASKIGGGNISPGAFRRRVVRYWHWHPLGCVEQSSSENRPRGCDMHRLSYTLVRYKVLSCTKKPLLSSELKEFTAKFLLKAVLGLTKTIGSMISTYSYNKGVQMFRVTRIMNYCT